MPGAPSVDVDVRSLAERLQANPGLVILDVREPYEVRYARLPMPQVCCAPLSQLAQQGAAALPAPAQDKQAEILVLCHHGVRSAQVTAWLRANGWHKAANLRGGIEAYAVNVDPSVGRY